MISFFLPLLILGFSFESPYTWAATSTQRPVHSPPKTKALIEQLAAIRGKVGALEQGLLTATHNRQNARSQVLKIQKLLKLQKMEKAIGQKRLKELETTVVALESRRANLKDKIRDQQKSIRKFLIAIDASDRGDRVSRTPSLNLPEQEKLEAPRRKVLGNLVDRGLKEIEALRADLTDAAQLEVRIQDEKHQLSYLFQDLKEQEGVLELNRQLQIDFLKKKRTDHLSQLENYRKLKNAEAQVEHLIRNFNARVELEHVVETEKKVAVAMNRGEFSKLKGRLPFPVLGGRVTSSFGRAFDPSTGLHIFKKGVEISVGKRKQVRAISAGKIAYSGQLPNYGQVVIIDHGEHFYSLCAHLGSVSKKTSDSVAAGDPVGLTADSETPLYFEIRSRNVAVNPLQWVFN